MLAYCFLWCLTTYSWVFSPCLLWWRYHPWQWFKSHMLCQHFSMSFGAGLYDFIVPMWRFLFQAKYFIAIGCQFFHQTIGSMNPKKMALIWSLTFSPTTLMLVQCIKSILAMYLNIAIANYQRLGLLPFSFYILMNKGWVYCQTW